MSNDTTKASNDVSRKEIKQQEVSDENMKEIITNWTGGEWIYVAATDPQFLDNILEENSDTTSASSNGSRRARHIRTSNAVAKRLKDLINYLTVTIGAKPQNERTEKVRKVMKKRAEQKAKAEKENKEGR